MDELTERLLAEIRNLIGNLGQDGGLISPSVYDTAQMLRLRPPPEGVEPGLKWLLAQQQPDGGWGDPRVPAARDIPTLAAMLALCELGQGRRMQTAVVAGKEYLERSQWSWHDVPMDAVPIAAEMILPGLLHEAAAHGIHLSPERYARLHQLRQKKRSALRGRTLTAGQAPTYSWEALGAPAHLRLLDAPGSVGHSPSATAACLHACKADGSASHSAIQAAERYLRSASHATGLDTPGVVPTVWPISGFERLYGLYALDVVDCLLEPGLQQPVTAQRRHLARLLKQNHGFDFGEGFVSDVDCTAVGICVLGPNEETVTPDLITQFQNGDHFFTYAGELNPSVFSVAHAVHALQRLGMRRPAAEQFLISRQRANGRWSADKWHSSWRYTTLECVLALAPLGHRAEMRSALFALLDDQNDDGGWGARGVSNALETAYGLMMLHTLRRHGLLHEQAEAQLQQAAAWLLARVQMDAAAYPRLWMGKELYSPRRVDHAFVLSATLLAARLHSPLQLTCVVEEGLW